jgi:hypothetical protein
MARTNGTAAECLASIPAVGAVALFLAKSAPGWLASNATRNDFVPRKVLISKQRIR